MTVTELATSAKRDVNDVIEALTLSTPMALQRYNKNTVIEVPDILHNAVRKLGVKFKVITHPDDKETEKKTQDQDAVKRYD